VGDQGREGEDGVERVGVDVDERMRRWWRRHAAPAPLAAFGIAALQVWGLGLR
jgi:hypothetical protein